MKYFRIFSDKDGESRFEEIRTAYSPMEYTPPFDISQPTDATKFVFLRFPAGWNSKLHPAPRRQLFIILSGTFQAETSSGEKMILKPGDVLRLEDTTGKGHHARIHGNSDVSAMMIHLE